MELVSKNGELVQDGKEKLGKTLLGKEVAMRAITQSVVDIERSMISVETGKRLFMNTNEELLPCSLKTTTKGGRRTGRLLEIFCLCT